MNLKFSLLISLLFINSSIKAAPPVDITNVEGRGSNRKILERSLTEDDVTYTDGTKETDRVPPGSARITFEIQGKSRPDRKGKDLILLKKGEFVTMLKASRDKRWTAIQVLHGKRIRAWVPKNALLVPKPAVSNPKKPNPSEDEEQIP